VIDCYRTVNQYHIARFCLNYWLVQKVFFPIVLGRCIFLSLSSHNYSMLDLPSVPRSCPTELFLHQHAKFAPLGKLGWSRCGRWVGHTYFISNLTLFYTDHVSYSLPTDYKCFCVLYFKTHSTQYWLYLTCCLSTVCTCIFQCSLGLILAESDTFSYLLWCYSSLMLTDFDTLLITAPT